jgi:hypothetical protein
MSTVSYARSVVTAAGTPLGGDVALTINDDGTYSVKFSMHSSSNFGSFDFRVLALLVAKGGPTLAFVHGGHVSGVNTNSHQENGRNEVIRLYWQQFENAGQDGFHVSKDYHWGGVVGTFNDLVKDVVTLGGGALGGTLGVVIGATKEATDWMGLDLGPGGTLGVIAGLAVFEVGLVAGLGSGGSFVVGTVAGVGTGVVANAMIKSEPLTEPEKILARRVFAQTVDLDRVRKTNFEGIGGRPFTAPGVDGLIYCNLGEGFTDPLGYSNDHYPTPGQVLIHELVHAWQICHSTSWPALMCSGFMNQTTKLFGDNVYAYGAPGPAFSAFNAEQQGAIVDQWFGASHNSSSYRPMSRANPYYRYVVDDLRFGYAVPDVSVTAVHPRSDEGAISLFTVGDDGFVWSNFWPAPPGTAWAGWHRLGGMRFPVGAPVSAIHARADEGATTLFVTDASGEVWTNFWPAPNSEAGLASGHIDQWSGWHALGSVKFAPGALVTAIHPRTDDGATTLFVTDLGGQVWTNFWPAPNSEAGLARGNTQWSGWLALGRAIFPAGAPVTAIHPRAEEGATSLFAVATDGKVWSNFWPTPHRLRTAGVMGPLPVMDETPQWSGWFPIGERTFRLGAEIAALHARSGEGALSLYAVAVDNSRVCSATWPTSAGSNAWSVWEEVGSKAFPQGATVTALHPRAEEGATSLFAVGGDGKMWSAHRLTGPDRWADWYPIGEIGFPRWANVAAVHPRSEDGAASVFAIGEDGKAWTTSWPASSDKAEWAPWYRLGEQKFPT